MSTPQVTERNHTIMPKPLHRTLTFRVTLPQVKGQTILSTQQFLRDALNAQAHLLNAIPLSAFSEGLEIRLVAANTLYAEDAT